MLWQRVAIAGMVNKLLSVLVLGFGVGFSPSRYNVSGGFGTFWDVSGLFGVVNDHDFSGAPACRGGQLPAVRAEEVVPLPTGLGPI
jgi:hypothetical protein